MKLESMYWLLANLTVFVGEQESICCRLRSLRAEQDQEEYEGKDD